MGHAQGESMVDRPLGEGDPVLLVGGTGLVGRALCAELARQGLVPLVVSRRPPPTGLLPPRVRHFALPVEQLPAALAAGQLAPATAPPAAPLGVVEILAGRAAGVRSLLRACRGRSGRFVGLSSAAVLGRAAPGKLHREEDPPLPATAAMRSKLSVEQLLAAAHARGSSTVALRLAYPYGPGHGPLTPLGRDRALFARLEQGEQLTWTLPGELAPLQPLWVEDLAAAIVALLRRPGRPRPLYHVAGPQILSWDGYLAVLAGAVGARPPRLRAMPADELIAEGRVAGGPGSSGPGWHRWLAAYLRHAPLLDDGRLRREVFACTTPLAAAAPRWAGWCLSGAP